MASEPPRGACVCPLLGCCVRTRRSGSRTPGRRVVGGPGLTLLQAGEFWPTVLTSGSLRPHEQRRGGLRRMHVLCPWVSFGLEGRGRPLERPWARPGHCCRADQGRGQGKSLQLTFPRTDLITHPALGCSAILGTLGTLAPRLTQALNRMLAATPRVGCQSPVTLEARRQLRAVGRQEDLSPVGLYIGSLAGLCGFLGPAASAGASTQGCGKEGASCREVSFSALESPGCLLTIPAPRNWAGVGEARVGSGVRTGLLEGTDWPSLPPRPFSGQSGGSILGVR